MPIFDTMRYLLAEVRAETLLKTNQIAMLTHFSKSNYYDIDRYWTSVRICIRNGYKIENANMWCDYIALLRHFGKDLHSPKYVCPTDLQAEHDRYVAKRRKEQGHDRAEKRKQALEDEEEFRALKSAFFGLCFSNGSIQIRMLESSEEVMLEGDALHHCVFANNYHLRENSLLFTARMNSERLETVEFSLSQMQVVQSRGLCNQNTEYHEQIIALVNQNKHLIRE